jgi:hypothetical protein
MKTELWPIALSLSLILVSSAGLEAQAQRQLGANISGHAVYNPDAFGGVFGWGGTLVLSFPNGLRIMGIGDYYRPDCPGRDDCTSWAASANLVTGGRRGRLRPRVGVGALYKRRSLAEPQPDGSDENSGWGGNLFVDLELMTPLPIPLKPYGQLRYEVGGAFGNEVVFAAGIRL